MKKLIFFFLVLTITKAQSQIGFGSGFVPQSAIRFIDSSGITTNASKAYVIHLAKSAEMLNVLSQHLAIYPFSGTTASQNSYNLVNVSTRRITWFGGVTHNSIGVTSNGTNGYGNPGIQDLALNTMNYHMSVYVSNEDLFTDFNRAMIGAASSNRFLIQDRSSNNVYVAQSGNPSLPDSYATITLPSGQQRGLLWSNRLGNENRLYFNDSTRSVTFNQGTISNINVPIILLGMGWPNSPFVIQYSKNTLAYASIGNAFTHTDPRSEIWRNQIRYAQSILNRQ